MRVLRIFRRHSKHSHSKYSAIRVLLTSRLTKLNPHPKLQPPPPPPNPLKLHSQTNRNPNPQPNPAANPYPDPNPPPCPLIRLMKLNRLFALMEEQLKLNPSLVRLVKLFLIFVFLWHWVGWAATLTITTLTTLTTAILTMALRPYILTMKVGCLWLFISNFEREDGVIDTEEMGINRNIWVPPPPCIWSSSSAYYGSTYYGCTYYGCT